MQSIYELASRTLQFCLVVVYGQTFEAGQQRHSLGPHCQLCGAPNTTHNCVSTSQRLKGVDIVSGCASDGLNEFSIDVVAPTGDLFL